MLSPALQQLTERAANHSREDFVGSAEAPFFLVVHDPMEVDSAVGTLSVSLDGELPPLSSEMRDAIPIRKREGGIGEDWVSLGRGRACDLVVRDASISKLHLELRYESGNWFVADLGSRNGTRMDDAKLEPHRPQALEQDHEIRIGNLGGRVVSAARLYEMLRDA